MKVISQEQRKKLSKALKGRSFEDLHGAKGALEHKIKISKAMKGNKNYISQVGKPRPCMLGNTFGFKKGKPAWNKGLTKEDSRVAKYTKAKVGKKRPDITGKKNPRHRPEVIAKYKEAQPETLRKILKAVCQRPNKFETRCMAYIETIYPGRFSYTGDGSCIINGRSADAADLKSRTVCLFNGCYWHLTKHGMKITDKNKRIVESIESDPFTQKGYRVIFIWEDEVNANPNKK